MIHLATRNLFQNRVRLLVSTGGVSLALLLILALDAIFAGVESQITAYIDHSGADVWVSQSGVHNLHMASSSIPGSLKREVQAVKGVRSVTAIQYLTNVLVMGKERNVAYIIGLPPDAQTGIPWNISTGKSIPGRGEVIINRLVVEKSGLRLGDPVEIFGREFKIAGFSEGTASLVSSVAFISPDDFVVIHGGQDTVSFLLVRVEDGARPEEIADRIDRAVPEVTAQTTADFARQERQVVKDMSTDIITIMNMIGFMIGLAVMALTVYTATLARRKEYGILKALGTRNLQLSLVVITQAVLSVSLGFSLGLMLTFLLSIAIPAFRINLALVIQPISLLKVGSLSLVIAGGSALLPIKGIANLDPMMVFRGK